MLRATERQQLVHTMRVSAPQRSTRGSLRACSGLGQHASLSAAGKLRSAHKHVKGPALVARVAELERSETEAPSADVYVRSSVLPGRAAVSCAVVAMSGLRVHPGLQLVCAARESSQTPDRI